MIPIKDSNAPDRFPIWVVALIAVNIYVFYLQLTTANPEAFITQYALIPANVDFSNPLTLLPFVTSQFLHGGFLHIISNMWFLWIFGDNVEDKVGFILFPLLYVASGIVGAFAQYIFMPDSTIPMLGASGAIAGILGAYFAWFPHHTVKTIIPFFGLISFIDIPASIMLIYWIVTQFIAGVGSFSGAETGGVAYFAHIGGFVAGYLLAKVIPTKPTYSYS